MNEVAIKIEKLSKHYHLGAINNDALFRDIQSWIALKRNKLNPHSKIGEEALTEKSFWALKDLNVEIKKGDRVGIIGKNGAGKSTLLKILSRITAPTTGNFKINGRVTSLLEVGTGFHPELTGRENIYLNGAILGMKRKDVDKKIDEIIEFSELEKHIDTPAKRYSSGMYVRLAFAVAAHLDSDILIADEVLAVGDAKFQKKALGKMNEISNSEGKTVLFVSHNMSAITQLCNKGMVLEQGQLKMYDDIDKCVSAYISHSKEIMSSNLLELPRLTRNCSFSAKIKEFTVTNVGSISQVIDSNKPCEFKMTIEVYKDSQIIIPDFVLSDGTQHISIFHSGIRNNFSSKLNKGIHTFVCESAPLNLYSGEYFVDLGLSSPGQPVDYIENAYSFEVEYSPQKDQPAVIEKNNYNGFVYIDYDWRIKNEENE
ncbi:MAG: ABC transporter ATP-binding protein [Fusobacteriaceae bacterium]|nr:ABC transporter ATP-binding protein [Fusobacteriaceae bacterium]